MGVVRMVHFAASEAVWPILLSLIDIHWVGSFIMDLTALEDEPS